MGIFSSKDSNINNHKLIIPKQNNNEYDTYITSLPLSTSISNYFNALHTLSTMNLNNPQTIQIYKLKCNNNKCKESFINKPFNIKNTDFNTSTSPFVYDKSLILSSINNTSPFNEEVPINNQPVIDTPVNKQSSIDIPVQPNKIDTNNDLPSLSLSSSDDNLKYMSINLPTDATTTVNNTQDSLKSLNLNMNNSPESTTESLSYNPNSITVTPPTKPQPVDTKKIESISIGINNNDTSNIPSLDYNSISNTNTEQKNINEQPIDSSNNKINNESTKQTNNESIKINPPVKTTETNNTNINTSDNKPIDENNKESTEKLIEKNTNIPVSSDTSSISVGGENNLIHFTFNSTSEPFNNKSSILPSGDSFWA